MNGKKLEMRSENDVGCELPLISFKSPALAWLLSKLTGSAKRLRNPTSERQTERGREQ